LLEEECDKLVGRFCLWTTEIYEGGRAGGSIEFDRDRSPHRSRYHVQSYYEQGGYAGGSDSFSAERLYIRLQKKTHILRPNHSGFSTSSSRMIKNFKRFLNMESTWGYIDVGDPRLYDLKTGTILQSDEINFIINRLGISLGRFLKQLDFFDVQKLRDLKIKNRDNKKMHEESFKTIKILLKSALKKLSRAERNILGINKYLEI